MGLLDDAALIDEYLQWRSIRELTPVDTTPQAFMQERVKEIAVDRLEKAIDYIYAVFPRRTDNGEFSGSVNGLIAILEGTDGQETDREDAGQEPVQSDDQNLADWEQELLKPLKQQPKN